MNFKNHKIGELDDLSKIETDILVNNELIVYCETCGAYHLAEGATWDMINKTLNNNE
jgi:hypothetical protein